VNFLVSSSGPSYTVAELATLGVKRISLGSALSRAALGALVRAAREIQQSGTFKFLDEALPFAEANDRVSVPTSD